MSEISRSMKIAIILFAAAFLSVAAIVVCSDLDKRNDGIMQNWEGMYISWYYPEYDEIILDSDLIVVATVTDKKGVWNTKDEKKPLIAWFSNAGINTEYTFEPKDILKGETATFKVRTPGGSADGYKKEVGSGSPSFEIGDHVLLFLTKNQDENGKMISWYFIGEPSALIEKSDYIFTNGYYGDLTVDQLKTDISNAENKHANS